MTADVILVAGGAGTRLGSALPKAWVPLGGKPVFRHSLEAFHVLPWVRSVVLVTERSWVARGRAAVRGLAKVRVVAGGARRQDSVVAGARAIAAGRGGVVLIHDSARPFPDPRVVAAVAREAARHGAAVAAVPMADTVKRAGAGGFVAATVPRAALWQAQTPQGIRRDLFPRWVAALEGGEVTDDVQPLENLGIRVKLVPGSRAAAKITWPEDLAAARRAVAGEPRVGFGWDLHRLVPGRPLVLAGVRFAFPRGLDGHSDADLVCHALTDALLGATGGGDIGTRFGVRRASTRNLSSLVFLSTVAREAAARGWRVVNADATLIAEAPKLGSRRGRMAANLARALGLAADRVSLKATTAKKTGPIGAGEAMGCLALVTVRRSEGGG